LSGADIELPAVPGTAQEFLVARETIAGLENSQRVSLEAGLLEPKDALKGFEGLFAGEFLR